VTTGLADPYVLVDTNAFIDLTRSQTRGRVLRRFVEQSRIVLSFVTVAELRLGALIRGYNDASRRRMESEIASAVVVSPTDQLSHEWARVVGEARTMNPGHALGQPAQNHDAWVAATALLFNLPLLTSDGHFSGFPGLRLLQAE
jgi:predicted nucleic acid-binding protein